MTGRKEIFHGGMLVVVDVDLVDRIWNRLPAAEAISGVRSGTLRPQTPADVPGEPDPLDATGLDHALEALTRKKLLAEPLRANLVARRAVGIPWRWFLRVPDEADERRLDSRLLRFAELTRLTQLTAAEIMAITSLVEKRMIGGGEAEQAFERWGSDTFQAALQRAPEDVSGVLREAWDDPTPLLYALELEDEGELWGHVAARVAQVRAVSRMAAESGAKMIPRTKTSWAAWLKKRAEARNRLT